MTTRGLSNDFILFTDAGQSGKPRDLHQDFPLKRACSKYAVPDYPGDPGIAGEVFVFEVKILGGKLRGIEQDSSISTNLSLLVISTLSMLPVFFRR